MRLVLDESGAVLDRIAYNAFGQIVAQLNPLFDNAILFASREFDAETGLYYNRARYLDPFTGRWTTQDPLGFAAGDANLYRYGFNSPTTFTDPSGYWNLWNPATWGTGNPSTDRWYDRINPFHGSAHWGDFFHGVFDGGAMVANAGLNTVTLGNSPLNGHVNDMIQQNGGAYGVANISANVGVFAGELAAGVASYRALRAASAANRATRIAELRIQIENYQRAIDVANNLSRTPANIQLRRELIRQYNDLVRELLALLGN